MKNQKNKKTIVLGVTGSIASYKSADIVSLLVKRGCDVFVVMTKEAAEFITPLTMQALSGNKVYTGMFDTPEEWDAKHISLAKKADAILIAPATANVIGKLVGGLCDDLLTCTVVASDSPVFIAPAMNDGMYNNKLVQENIAKLKKIGYKFIGPRVGRLACGYEAIGCLAEVETIVKALESSLK